MDINQAFGKALRAAREHRDLPQDAFAVITSQTFISLLEHGRTSPSLRKLDSLAPVLRTHPATLVILAYFIKDGGHSVEALFSELRNEVEAILSSQPDIA